MLNDPLFWILTLPGILIGLYAQAMIKKNYVRYSSVPSAGGLTGAQTARRMLDANGLQGVAIEPTPGVLSDHYDPRAKVLRLSSDVYHAPTLAAEGIAAHETGHALQDADDYAPMELRTWIVPVVALSSKTAPWAFIGGFMLDIPVLAWAGVAMFAASTLFAIITLPVELDASRRAQELLVGLGLVTTGEQAAGVRSVLRSAAWTYVAGAVSALGSLLYFGALLFSRSRGRGGPA